MKAMLYVLISGVGFAWPVALRYFKLSAIDATLAVSAGTFLFALCAKFGQDVPETTPWRTVLIVMIICGVTLNGLSTYLYNNLVSGQLGNPTIYIPSVVVTMLLALVVGNVILHGDRLALINWAGVVTLLVGVFLLFLK